MIDSLKKTGFVYHLECIGVDGKTKWKEIIHNLIPDVGRDYILNAAMTGGAQFSTWYIGLYENARTPVAADTMTLLLADAGESVAYDGGVRLTLTPDALANGLFSNVGTPAEFVFATEVTIRGGFITTNSVRNNTTGLLLSAGLLPSAKTVEVGETLRVKAGWQLITI